MSVEPTTDKADLQAVYAATAEDRVVQFTSAEKHLLFKALWDTIPKFRSQIRIFTPLSALYNLCRQHSNAGYEVYPCRGGSDFFFVDAAEGNTYPCGYRGRENLGKFWNLTPGSADSTSCKQCDWECFRDPSELLGPLLEDVWRPLKTLLSMPQRKNFFRHWVRDLAYYRACDFFDGRCPPNYGRMARYSAVRKQSRPKHFIHSHTNRLDRGLTVGGPTPRAPLTGG
jgi:hypothetical protein